MSTAHVHIVCSGTMPGGEIFAFGWDYAGAAGNQTTLDGIVSDVATALSGGTIGGTIRSLISSGGYITAVTGYSYADASSPAVLASSTVVNLAGSGTGKLPYQCALVATLRTAVPSRRTRGRMYLPATGVTMGAGNVMTSPTVDSVATAVRDLISAPGEGVIPNVVSKAGSIMTPVTTITVDNKVDTQRRRAQSVAATVTGSAPYPAP
uniref:Uncharacterized protein n=1 Tax=uncultured prokaryote TaxID=198431 RepID=A0A0H5Q7K7_9ZZZZ|nr:hypothetical protein [uncultured prokaryote]